MHSIIYVHSMNPRPKLFMWVQLIPWFWSFTIYVFKTATHFMFRKKTTCTPKYEVFTALYCLCAHSTYWANLVHFHKCLILYVYEMTVQSTFWVRLVHFHNCHLRIELLTPVQTLSSFILAIEFCLFIV